MMNGGVKNGLSTLNRLLGKKNKDESSSQSKHPSTFSRSMSNLDTSSQHNKIVPLAAMSNAPFEQTFRITVCLPRDQLYVARVGAKTRLAQLMELTCINKQLDRDKYEFRHPLDNSQVFRNDLTIGEVGLNEIRLVPKTERLHNGNNFNLEDLGKMRVPGNRESLSSSEVSRNSRHFPKTTSPYSSTNSLNSVESSGSRSHQAPVAPARKKRAAPRPPSQNSIPEHQDRATVDINRNSTITGQGGGAEVFKKPLPVKKNFHVSSPNLSLEENHQLITSAEVHRNGSPVAERYSSVTDLRSHDTPAIVEASNARIRPMSMHIFNGNHHVNGKESSTDVNHSRTSSESSEMRDSLPEPVPRKRQLFAAKKKKAAPAPPPRSFAPVPTPRSIPKSESSADEETKSDATSIRSQESSPSSSVNNNLPNGNVSKVMLNVDTTDVSPPVNAVKEEQPAISVTKQSLMVEERKECIGVKVVEMQPNGPLSIAIKSTVMQKEEPAKVSITEIRRESTNSSDDDDHRVNIYNIKTGTVIEKPLEVAEVQKGAVEDAKVEAVPEVQKVEDVPKVQKEEAVPEVQKEEAVPEVPKAAVPAEDPRSPSPLWTYTLPAPPKFADGNSSVPDDVTTLNGNVYYDYMSVADDTRTVQSDSNTTLVSDVDIRPVIREVVPDPYINDLDAEVVNSDVEDGYRMDREMLLQSLEKRRERYIENEFAFLTKMDDEPEKLPTPVAEKVPKLEKQQSIEMGKSEVMGELNSVINSKKIDSVIRKAEVPEEIETAKPCNLSNFRISTYSNGEEEKPAPQLNGVPGVPGNEEEFNEEDFLRRASIDDKEKPREFVKRPSLTNGCSQVFRKSNPVARSDSFHSTRTDFPGSFAGTPRSSSYISLLTAQKFESRHSPRNSLELANPPRRYSSELSITDSPSLQSIEVMKSILSSSRKNSITHLAEPTEPEIVAENGLQETKIVTVKEIMREKEPEVSQVEAIEEPQKPEKAILVQQKEEAEDCPKKWVYKGPPKINLSAWSERPKVQVCIKSDSDYCFGGSTTLPRGFRTVEQRVQEEEQKLADAANHHLPVVRSVEYKKNIQPPEETEPPAAAAAVILRKPEVRQKPVNRVNSITSASLNARPLSLGNFSKIAPVVRGFRAEEDPAPVKTFTTVSLNRTASVTKVNTPTTPPAASAEPPSQLKKPVLERRSIAVVNGQKNIEVVPFSQHTLRRTGLKEKILAQEEEAQKAPSQPRTFQSRQQTINHSISLPPPEPIKTPPEPPKILSTPAPPPPPPQLRPVVRAVVKKQISAPELDPRDQLLNSIRNFNKGSLRKM
ncbi:titin isoform X2 [Phlebotomus papatasi]|uniref:titin isoform X2 n=1 Tax=Phlebotomus papatasi TaxID=29031 RepID=UPI002483EF1F|nr:titin isoform X2 [Phlebotomus papatasi]XP_055716345.1 titin isoform X2 [Phlebotomus papatasi]